MVGEVCSCGAELEVDEIVDYARVDAMFKEWRVNHRHQFPPQMFAAPLGAVLPQTVAPIAAWPPPNPNMVGGQASGSVGTDGLR